MNTFAVISSYPIQVAYLSQEFSNSSVDLKLNYSVQAIALSLLVAALNLSKVKRSSLANVFGKYRPNPHSPKRAYAEI